MNKRPASSLSSSLALKSSGLSTVSPPLTTAREGGVNSGRSFTGFTVIGTAWGDETPPSGSETVTVRFAVVVSLPSWMKYTRPSSRSAWVKLKAT